MINQIKSQDNGYLSFLNSNTEVKSIFPQDKVLELLAQHNNQTADKIYQDQAIISPTAKKMSLTDGSSAEDFVITGIKSDDSKQQQSATVNASWVTNYKSLQGSDNEETSVIGRYLDAIKQSKEHPESN